MKASWKILAACLAGVLAVGAVIGVCVGVYAAKNKGTVPGMVATIDATPRNGAVILEWTAPTDNGGKAITGFQVRQGDGDWISMPATAGAYTFYNLTNGTPYTFKVRAVNAKGAGEAKEKTATPLATLAKVFEEITVPYVTEITWKDALYEKECLYKFTLAEVTRLLFEIEAGASDCELFSDEKNLISIESGTSFTWNLLPGTYYVRVSYTGSADAKSDFEISFAPMSLSEFFDEINNMEGNFTVTATYNAWYDISSVWTESVIDFNIEVNGRVSYSEIAQDDAAADCMYLYLDGSSNTQKFTQNTDESWTESSISGEHNCLNLANYISWWLEPYGLGILTSGDFISAGNNTYQLEDEVNVGSSTVTAFTIVITENKVTVSFELLAYGEKTETCEMTIIFGTATVTEDDLPSTL